MQHCSAFSPWTLQSSIAMMGNRLKRMNACFWLSELTEENNWKKYKITNLSRLEYDFVIIKDIKILDLPSNRTAQQSRAPAAKKHSSSQRRAKERGTLRNVFHKYKIIWKEWKKLHVICISEGDAKSLRVLNGREKNQTESGQRNSSAIWKCWRKITKIDNKNFKKMKKQDFKLKK